MRENIYTYLIRVPQGKARENEMEAMFKEKAKNFPELTKNSSYSFRKPSELNSKQYKLK